MMLLMYLMFIIAMNNKLNYSRYIITFNSYYLEMWATEWFLKWEIKTLVDKLRDKEEENRLLKERIRELEEQIENLKADWKRWYRHMTRAEIDKIINDY